MASDLLTLDALKRMLSLNTSDSTDDLVLRALIGVASDSVTQYTGRTFVPQWATRLYDAIGEHITSRKLELDRDLLEVTALTNGDGTEISVGDYLLVPYNGYPKRAILLKSSSVATFSYSDAWEAAISVAGVWGYHDDWQNAWIDTLDSVNDTGGVGAAATTITVADASGVDALGYPRFAVLQYLKCDDEVMQVMAVDTEDDTLTVRRGQLGTEAAAHEEGEQLYRYAPQREVEQAALSLAAWLYRNRTNLGEKYQFLNGTQLVVNEAPAHIRMALSAYRKVRME